MLQDLLEVRSSTCSNTIFQNAQNHGKKQQTTKREDTDNVETLREAGHV